jgi:hypothetical protein
MTPSMTSRISSKVDKIISLRNNLRLWLFPRNPPIASGATLIRSIDRLLDEMKRDKKFLAGYDVARIAMSKYFLVYNRMQAPDYSLGGYYHRER